MGPIKQAWERNTLRLAVAICIILTIASQSLGKNISTMYRVDDLSGWKERYSQNILWNLEHVIKPVLIGEELRVYQEVELEFPLFGEEGEPFEYKARVAERSIVIPIFSIKFLDDLTIAAAWLSANNYTYETIPEYISMLKYREANEFPNGRYPTPLEGLHIPNNALDNSEVDERAQELLKLTVIYLLGRELGFIYVATPSLEFQELSESQELRQPEPSSSPQTLFSLLSNQAKQLVEAVSEVLTMREDRILRSDALSLEFMRRIGVLPFDLIFYLTAQTYWTPNQNDFPIDEFHPVIIHSLQEYALFPERLSHMTDLMVRGKEEFARKQYDEVASALQIEITAREILKLVEVLESDSLQQEIKRAAITRTIDDLRPR